MKRMISNTDNSDTPPLTPINVPLITIPNSNTIILGRKGESIFMGGIGISNGIVGAPNHYKSTIVDYLAMSALDQVLDSYDSYLSKYDTENMTDPYARFDTLVIGCANITPDRIGPSDNTLIEVTNAAAMNGDDFSNMVKDFMNEKQKNKREYYEYAPILKRNSNESPKVPPISFLTIDSLGALNSEKNDTANDTSKAKPSDDNTQFMRGALFRKRFLSAASRLAPRSNTYMFYTAHLGEKIDMSGMFDARPLRKTQFIKGNIKIKDVPDDFLRSLSSAWIVENAKVLKDTNKSTGKITIPEYQDAEYPDPQGNDINEVTLTPWRSKLGTSGYSMKIVVSQKFGVQQELTAIHNLLLNGYYGISGTHSGYYLDLYPDVKFTRKKVREVIREDDKFRKATMLTYSLHQVMLTFGHLEYTHGNGFLVDPKILREDITALGYDWDILFKTREYWTPDQYNTKIKPYLSIIDLLRMRKGLYTPYWYSKENM